MKNKLLQITAAALFAFPMAGFCQSFDAPGQDKTTIASIVETDHCFANGQCFSAFVDNAKVPIQGFRPISATLVAVPTAQDVDMGARTIVNILIGGKGDGTMNESMQHETIQMQLVLTEPISPGSVICHVLLNHESAAYAQVKGDASNVEVTDFIWSMDRKSFMLSLNFNCTMRSSGFPGDGKKDVNLKGQIVRVQVAAAPDVISASN